MEKMTTCKTCGAEIAKSAKVCPKCGGKQKKLTFGRVLLLIIGVFLVIIGVGMSTGGSDGPSKVSSDPQAAAQQIQEEENEAFTVGDTVELSGTQVTFLGFTTSNGANYVVPSDGNVFAIAELEVTNNGSTDLTVSSMVSFTAYCDDYILSLDLMGSLVADKNMIDGLEVSPGKKAAGVLTYQIPADWEAFELHYTNSLYSSKEIVFTVENPQ